MKALSPAERKVAQRALDFAGGPGLIGPDVLVGLEDADVSRSMFPAEKKRRKHLWRAIEWEPVPEAVQTPVAPLLTVNDCSRLTAAAIDPQLTAIPISSLQPELRELGMRVALVLGDAKATTLSLADIIEVVRGGSFTDREKQQLGVIS